MCNADFSLWQPADVDGEKCTLFFSSSLRFIFHLFFFFFCSGTVSLYALWLFRTVPWIKWNNEKRQWVRIASQIYIFVIPIVSFTRKLIRLFGVGRVRRERTGIRIDPTPQKAARMQNMIKKMNMFWMCHSQMVIFGNSIVFLRTGPAGKKSEQLTLDEYTPKWTNKSKANGIHSSYAPI